MGIECPGPLKNPYFLPLYNILPGEWELWASPVPRGEANSGMNSGHFNQKSSKIFSGLDAKWLLLKNIYNHKHDRICIIILLNIYMQCKM